MVSKGRAFRAMSEVAGASAAKRSESVLTHMVLLLPPSLCRWNRCFCLSSLLWRFLLGSGIFLAVKSRSSERSEAERVCSNSDGFASGVSSSASQENLRASRSFAKTGFTFW